jgi:hypothetical protein
LSEFFKIDATDKNYNLLLDSISRIPKVDDPERSLKILLENLSSNLLNSVVKQNGEKIINHLTKDLSGIIFKDNIFVQKEDIHFYWNNIGYANRPRLSIWYEVDKNALLWKISKDENGFTRYVIPI